MNHKIAICDEMGEHCATIEDGRFNNNWLQIDVRGGLGIYKQNNYFNYNK